MYTLAIETANKTLSVALIKDDVVQNIHTQTNTLQHSVTLVPTVEKLMRESNISHEQLEKIVVSNGPGSYTGLRIGVTFAKTLAYTLNIPVVPVSSLAVLQAGVSKKEQYIIPFFDARRQNVYAGMYYQHREIIKDQYIQMSELLQKVKALNEPVVFISPDMDYYEQIIQEYLGDLAKCYHQYPSAAFVYEISKQQPNVQAHLLTPTYLKQAEAEEIWLTKHSFDSSQQWVERGSYVKE